MMDKSQQEQKQERAAKKKTAEKQRRRVSEIDTLIERLYVDNASGKVSDDRFGKLSAKFEAEQAALVQALDLIETELAELESQSVNVDKFLDTVRRNAEVEKLTPAIVHEFIDRIIIHEPEQARKNRRQKVEIVYHKIGKIDLADWLAESA